ncbi:MAG: asparagine synthase (glutamine-hydrolyzing) [bacterium]|nr:asparagine synthase (glutamine-hydrolyzing) [bacterium]
MSAIAGFFQPQANFLEQEGYYRHILENMNHSQRRRGPDDFGSFLNGELGLSYAHLSTQKDKKAKEPIYRQLGSFTSALAMDGELYNREELIEELQLRQAYLGDKSDANLLLSGLLEFGTAFLTKTNGVFAGVWYQEKDHSLTLFRDRLGVKPLFYTQKKHSLIFASEPKALFAYPDVEAAIDLEGLNELFSIGPARSPEKAVFYQIFELPPAHTLKWNKEGYNKKRYWQLPSYTQQESEASTIEHVSFLIRDAVKRQMAAEIPICTLLSGGVDSSLVSAICAQELKKQNRKLTTYSFDFKDSTKHFKANAFQPSLDRPYVEQMVAFLDSDHHYLECDAQTQTDALTDSVLAHDLPAMADVDSSLLHFCSQIAPSHRIALTGECADEIFGGYPWFYKEEFQKAHTFPWTMQLDFRKSLLKDDFLQALDMDAYVAKRYEETLAAVPYAPEDSPAMRQLRKLSYLNLTWFMQTLLNRMDRAAAYSGMVARVPFADYRIVEYLWNLPWEKKAYKGIVKGLLREAGADFLPDSVLWRKKSPYPKSYDASYEKRLATKLRKVLASPSSPLLHFVDVQKVERFLQAPSDYGKPWYGQLMAAPQMMAYLLQINLWLEQYRVRIK